MNTVEIDPNVYEFAPQMQERVQAQIEEDNWSKNKPNSDHFTYSSGFYPIPIYIEKLSPFSIKNRKNEQRLKEIDPISNLREPLTGIEQNMYSTIQNLLKAKKNEPVVIGDYGAGVMCLTLLRLSLQPDIQEALESGRLIFVATNLIYTPNNTFTDFESNRTYIGLAASVCEYNYYHAIDNKGNELPKVFSSEDLDTIEKHQHYIKFLTGNIKDIITQNPSLKMDLWISRRTLTHSHIPDYDLGVLASTLSDHGTLILRKIDTERFGVIGPLDISALEKHRANKEYEEARVEAWEKGVSNIITHFNLRQIFGRRKIDNYYVFQKPNAPSLRKK